MLVQGPRLSRQRRADPTGRRSLRHSLAILPDCLNLPDLMAVVQLSLRTDLSIRLDICRQVSVGDERFGRGASTLRTHFACQWRGVSGGLQRPWEEGPGAAALPDQPLTGCALARQLFHLIYRQPDALRLLAQQAGWQDVLTRLYVLEAAPAGSPLAFTPELPASPEPALSNPSTESPEPSDVFLPSEAPCPDPDAFYQALSPFCAPLDLGGLERASVGSGNTAGGGGSSGTLTPASQPGTPSPLDGPRPFPAAHGRHSSSLSNVLEDGSLLEPTISGDDTSNTSNPQVRRAHPPPLHGTKGGHLWAMGQAVWPFFSCQWAPELSRNFTGPVDSMARGVLLPGASGFEDGPLLYFMAFFQRIPGQFLRPVRLVGYFCDPPGLVLGVTETPGFSLEPRQWLRPLHHSSRPSEPGCLLAECSASCCPH